MIYKSAFHRIENQPGLQTQGLPGREKFFPPPINLNTLFGPPLFLPGLIGRSTVPQLFISKTNTVHPTSDDVNPGSFKTYPRQKNIFKGSYDDFSSYKDVYSQTRRKSIPMNLVPLNKFPTGAANQILYQDPMNPFVAMSVFPTIRGQRPLNYEGESEESKRWPAQGKERLPITILPKTSKKLKIY